MSTRLPLLAGAGILLATAALSMLRGCMKEHYRPHGHQDMTIAVSPQGDRIVFNAVGEGGRDLYVINLQSRKVALVAATPMYEVTPSFSPDGASIVYAAGAPGDRADHIFVRPTNGGEPRQLTDDDANDSAPRFSPDGSKIVFSRDTVYQWGGLAANWSGTIVATMDQAGTHVRQLTADSTWGYSPRFTHDGRAVRYWTADAWREQPLDDARAAKRLAWPNEGDGDFSPDDSLFSFSRGKYSPDCEIYISGPEGADIRQVTHSTDGCFRPVFMPDGMQLLFLQESWPDGPTGSPAFSLWRIGVDGAGLLMLADSQFFDAPLAWTPGGDVRQDKRP